MHASQNEEEALHTFIMTWGELILRLMINYVLYMRETQNLFWKEDHRLKKQKANLCWILELSSEGRLTFYLRWPSCSDSGRHVHCMSVS